MVSDESINYQITPSITDFVYVDNIDPSNYDLVFLAEDLPPLGVKYYYVEVDRTTSRKNEHIPKESSNRNYIGGGVSITTSSSTLLFPLVLALRKLLVPLNRTYRMSNETYLHLLSINYEKKNKIQFYNE